MTVSAQVGESIWCIWSSKSAVGRANLQHGLETNTWGFREPPLVGSPEPGDLVVFGMDHSGSSVRVPSATWNEGTASIVVAEVTSPLYEASSPHWPDEVAASSVIYPRRFGFVVLGSYPHVSLGSEGGIDPAIVEGLRLFALSHRARLTLADGSGLRALLGIEPHPGARPGPADISATLAATNVARANAARGARQGRSSDAAFNRAVEKHAVALAIDHMRERHGWSDISELGKPFDLICRNGAVEKHIEVKGTTGAGSDVVYTPNEVDHFRNCPYGADLIIVRDIRVDRTSGDYGTSGGELLHIENYTAPQEDLQPIKWLGRVLGWSESQ